MLQLVNEPSGPEPATAVRVPIGRAASGPLELDLNRLMAGRLLIQGSSGAGKSHVLRRIVEEAFDYVTTIIVDPEGEFENLARHIGATTIHGSQLANDGMTAAAARARAHRLPLHVDLTDLVPDQRIEKAAAFFAGLVSVPREQWGNSVLVCIDEAHLLAPHLAASSRDAETRRLGVATLTDMCARGRKRGIGTIIATQRLAKLAGSVLSELQSCLVGLNVFDRDIARAADLLGFGREDAARLRSLNPGEFFANGPALCRDTQLCIIDRTVTEHIGATPALKPSADLGEAEGAALLGLEGLVEPAGRAKAEPLRGSRAIDMFLMNPAAGTAARIVEALRRISPNATTASDLVQHLASDPGSVDDALDLLGNLGAVDTMPRGSDRLARMSARLRQREIDVPVVGLL
jgi:hypothetical protein